MTPARTTEEAQVAYRRARKALAGKDPSEMREALSGLPEWPSHKATDLRARLHEALGLPAPEPAQKGGER